MRLLLTPLLPAVLAALIAGGCMNIFGIRRGDLPEPPPAELAGKGMAPGYHEIRPATEAEVDQICRMLGVSANDQFNRRVIAACVVPSTHAVILPADGAVDDEKLQAMRAHEDAHTWGAVHQDGGRGWILPQNLFAQGQATTVPAGNPFGAR